MVPFNRSLIDRPYRSRSSFSVTISIARACSVRAARSCLDNQRSGFNEALQLSRMPTRCIIHAASIYCLLSITPISSLVRCPRFLTSTFPPMLFAFDNCRVPGSRSLLPRRKPDIARFAKFCSKNLAMDACKTRDTVTGFFCVAALLIPAPVVVHSRLFFVFQDLQSYRVAKVSSRSFPVSFIYIW